jgi:thiamine-monophosphate kinase
MGRHPLQQMSGEDRLIARHFKPLATHPGAYALEDDAAVLKIPAGHEVVLKADAIVEGIHFFSNDPAETVARKALRVNLSDLAAKGAKPAGFLLSIALPKKIGWRWLTAFARGLAADAKRYGCPLMGGDTDRTFGPVTVSVAAFGLLPAGRMVRRRGARPGDRIVVSGTIGDAALGLRLRQAPQQARQWRLTRPMRQHLLTRYLLPQPRQAIAAALRSHATAAMDISDGLVGDLTKLCRTSGVGAEIDATCLPLSPAARQALASDRGLMVPILTGGDDYEIIATVAARDLSALQSKARAAGVALTEIGRVVKGGGVRVIGPDGRPMTFKRAAFSHF